MLTWDDEQLLARIAGEVTWCGETLVLGNIIYVCDEPKGHPWNNHASHGPDGSVEVWLAERRK